MNVQTIRFFKFGLVGISGVLVNMGMLWFLKSICGFPLLISSAIAIALSIFNNFMWNDLWTWKDHRRTGFRPAMIRFLKFCLVSCLATYVVNFLILWSFTRFLNMNYLAANMIGIAAGSIINFILNHTWTFNSHTE
jgi:dolichol-phosphate mannosyltransferase